MLTMAGLITGLRGGWLLPAVLSTTAGAVDVIGFLALGGLFSAHITGNLVILATHYAIGCFGEIGPLLSVPVFVAVLGAVTLAAAAAEKAGHPTRRALLVLQAALLAGCLALGVRFGPFPDTERPLAVFVGMLAVAAMATQNALVRFALHGSPSTAVMTTNITQLTVDLATLAWGERKPDDHARARRRAGVTGSCVVGFVAGCAAGAALEVYCGLWALALPVALAVAAVPLGELWGDGPTEAARPTGAAGGHSASARTAAPDHASGMGQQTSHGRDQDGIPRVDTLCHWLTGVLEGRTDEGRTLYSLLHRRLFPRGRRRDAGTA
jgi:uncharacterized membrane protein YoaK (UPF0700 family)